MIEESEPSEGQNQKIANIYFHPSWEDILSSITKKSFKKDKFFERKTIQKRSIHTFFRLKIIFPE